MANPTVPDLKELFKQAAEIAGQVPENMQVAAFQRAVDLLTGTNIGLTQPIREAKGAPSTPLPAQSRARPNAHRQTSAVETEDGAPLIARINSTQHPGVASASKVLDRALMVLQIALNEYQVDGLTPGEISRILTDKFRVSTTDAAVRMSLASVPQLVDRVARGTGFVYRIMGPGEKYLAHLGQGDANEGNESARVKRRARSKTAKKKAESAVPSPAQEVEAAPSPKGKRRSSSKPNTRAILLTLIEAGYFAEPRTAPQVQDHLGKKRGYTIDTDVLRINLLRLVRNGTLERNENSDGHYEYKKP